MKKLFSLFLFFLTLNLFVFWGLWDIYFLQDEWFLFGRAIYQSQDIPLSFLNFASTHFWPLGNAVWYLLFKTIKFNAEYYALLSILLHTTLATLLFYFFQQFTKKTLVPIVLVILFAISYPTMQPVVWFVIPPFLIPSIIFIIIFFIYLFKKTNKKFDLRDIIIFSALFITSFLFREESVILILLFPLYVYLFWNKQRKTNIKPVLIILGVMLLMVIIRFSLQPFLGDNVKFENESVKKTTVYNLITTPPKMVVQNIIARKQLIEFSREYTKLAYPKLIKDGFIVEVVLVENLIYLMLIPFALIIGFSFAKMDTKNRKVLIFAVVWIILSAFILSPQTRRLLFLESRYLYLGNIGVLLMLYVIINFFYSYLGRFKNLIIVISILYISVFSIYSYVNIQKFISKSSKISKNRIDIIDQIFTNYPKINNKNIFYVTCKYEKDCLANPFVLPFQSGVGQMLLVLYGSENEKAYAPFFKDFYLWGMRDEDYKEYGNYGFGYFRDFTKLQQAYLENKLNPDSVIAISYDKSTNSIIDISDSIRNKLIEGVQLAQ